MNAPNRMAGAAEPEHTFRGSHFEIGRLHGAQLQRRIVGEMQAAWSRLAPGSGVGWEGYIAAFQRQCLPWVRHHLPQVEKEVEGLAHGGGFSFAEAFFAAFHGGASPLVPEGDCTAFYCGREATREGRIYLGQTKDTPTPATRYVTMRLDYLDGPEVILLNYPGWIANLGLTSRGIAFTGNARYATAGGRAGLPLSLLKKAILEARSLPDLEPLMERDAWQDGALLMADRKGYALCVEFIHGKGNLVRPGAGVFAHTNTILEPAARGADLSATASPSAASRLRAAHAFLERTSPEHDTESLRRLARDHSGWPGSICLHSEAHPGESATTAAMIADLERGRIEIAVGQPCGATFVPYDLRVSEGTDRTSNV